MDPRSSHDHQAFGDLLRRHRLASGLSQEQLADQSGVSVRGISDLERGLRQAPRRSTVQLLTRALGLSLGDSAELHLVSRRAAALQRQEASTSRSNGPDPLPAPVDQFIGRSNEIETITSLLHESPARLVTIAGPGGVGKTRLALEVARRLAGSGSHRVAFVSLAQLTDHRSVLPAIAQMFGVTGGDEASLMRRLVAGVAGARHLLVLDNFEHLLQAAPVVVELLERCSDVQVLVTSRAALGVAGERRFPLEPMPVPEEREPTRGQSIEDLSEIDSVRLFVERARSANTVFDLDEPNTVAIGAICRHLEGLPLAIELAAARTGALNAPALLQSLQPRLPHLTSGYRNRPERLQTMRNAVAWSFELLSPEEQTLFCRLGVFEGGFGLDSVSAVVGSTQSTAELLGQISSLVDQSLVRSQQSADGLPRFRMLETIREFAVEQLEHRGETDETRRAHAGVFLALAEELRPSLEGASGAAALERLEAEHGNLLASLSFFTEWEESEAALQLGGALWKFCFIHGHLSVGLDRLERALALPQTAYSDALAEALYGAGVLSRELGDLAKAREYGTELLEKAEAHDDSVHRAMAHFLLGTLSASERDLDRARIHYDESLSLFREHRHAHGTAMMLHQRANLAREMGDHELAESGHREALAIWREREDQWGVGLALNGMGLDAEAQRKDEQAAEAYFAAIDLHDRLGAQVNVLTGIEGIARLAARRRQPELAIRLLSAAESVHRSLGNEVEPLRRARNDAALEMACAVIGETRYASLWEAGQSLTLDAAVTIAEAEFELPQRPAARQPVGPSLSKRETEVLRLVATGQTDREIGEVLFISRRTVTTHVTSILNKLGVDSRTAAAAIAVRNGLV